VSFTRPVVVPLAGIPAMDEQSKSEVWDLTIGTFTVAMAAALAVSLMVLVALAFAAQ
jgi:uncharacterized membrane protein YqjE